MNKKLLVSVAIGMFACAVISSCSKDDNGDSGLPGVQSGTLVGDDAELNAAVEGIRISSVGSSRYEYDENGVLSSISGSYADWKAEKANNFKVEWSNKYDQGAYSFSVINNHVTAISCRESYEEKGEEDTTNGNMSFSYNAKGQLASISWNSSGKILEEGETYTYSSNGTTNYNYSSDHRLLSIKAVSNYNEGGERAKQTILITFDYSTNYPNSFYQFTPGLLQVLDEMGYSNLLPAFAYVGLFGKASSYLPSGYTWEKTEEWDGENDSYSNHHSCSYSFNKNGTISYADRTSYSYTNVGTRAVFDALDKSSNDEIAEENSRLRFIKRIHRHNKNKQ